MIANEEELVTKCSSLQSSIVLVVAVNRVKMQTPVSGFGPLNRVLSTLQAKMAQGVVIVRTAGTSSCSGWPVLAQL